MGQLFQLFNVHSQPNNKSQKKNNVSSSLSTNSTFRHRTNKLFKKKKDAKPHASKRREIRVSLLHLSKS